MQRIQFFSRVALLCNLCFLVVFFLRYVPFVQNGIITSTLIILGSVISIVINTLIMLLYFFLVIVGGPLRKAIPVWLIITNILFFIFQVILLIK